MFAVGGIPEIADGDDLAEIIDVALRAQETPLEAGDVLVVTQKIVSKAEGRVILLDDVEAGSFAREWAEAWEKDARSVELVLRESARIVRMSRGLIVAETKHGWVCANAGVDQSNVGGGAAVALLPLDSSASAGADSRGAARAGQSRRAGDRDGHLRSPVAAGADERGDRRFGDGADSLVCGRIRRSGLRPAGDGDVLGG